MSRGRLRLLKALLDCAESSYLVLAGREAIKEQVN